METRSEKSEMRCGIIKLETVRIPTIAPTNSTSARNGGVVFGPGTIVGSGTKGAIKMTSAKRAEFMKGQQAQFNSNRKKILASQDVCGICGKPVDKSLKYPHPLSPTIDHIIPLEKGGHPSDIGNLQLAHFTCNRQKSDKLFEPPAQVKAPEKISNRVLPQTFDWRSV